MHLSKLNITGFKSYSETVSFDFSPVIAVIIGNNGTGKSNSLEAILWGLGEDDPVALRAARPQDLLFAGSGKAPPAEAARVELFFGDLKDEARIKVTRALLRSGEERLGIDGKDLKDLEVFRAALEELGLAACRQNLIRQDQIGDFFVKDPAERLEYVGSFLNGAGLEGLNAEFSRYMGQLIPEASARLVGDDGGLEVEVTFEDKGAKPGLSLSGGERAVTALALKLALFGHRPSPCYLLDEVEPALDWVKNKSTQNLLTELSASQQLIIVTHLRSTIELADTVHGVRIRRDGSSWLKFHFVMDERLFKIYKCC
jgi:chromosome segregation ATPase